ncbi:MAG: LD-carboxypeptidase [Planctomycetes bacterium]|nr:LD-carboxypeptidase [Planctomycetota bacterium]
MKAQAFFPASLFSEDLFSQGKEICQKRLGVELVHETLPVPQAYSAGPLSERRDSFLAGLNGPEVEILWAARGGYGTVEWLGDLPKNTEKWQGKTLIGYSDLTALHAFTSNLGLRSIHGPMIATKNWCEATDLEINSLKHAIHGEKQKISCQFNSNDTIQGRLVGGNLTVLASLMGTPWQLKLQPGDILFLEDINEAHYALARSLRQLSFSENFAKVTILWGHLSSCAHSFSTEQELLQALMTPYENLWGCGIWAGHEQENLSLPLGLPAKIERNTLFLK